MELELRYSRASLIIRKIESHIFRFGVNHLNWGN